MLSAHIAAFLVSRRALNLSVRTVEWYAWTLGQFSNYTNSRLVDAGLLREFIADLCARELSAYTLRNYVRVLKTFYRWCVNDELRVDDPSARLAMPKLPKRVPRGIGIDDLRALLACACVRDRAVMLMLIDAGLRVSELNGLFLRDVDLETGHCKVLGKGSQERFAFFSAPTGEAIKQWLAVRSKESEFLFVTAQGERFKDRTITQILRRLQRRAGVLGRCNPHSFRHAFAREFLVHGGDLASLSNLLGHSDVRTTMIYSAFTSFELQLKHARHSPVKNLVLA